MAANYWRLKTARFTAAGADKVIVFNGDSPANEVNIMVETGTVEIAGDTNQPNNVFGDIPETPIIISAGQAYHLNEIQYTQVTVRIKDGATVQLSANI
jgi:hypothetical protein